LPGPFFNLGSLRWDDEVVIHARGLNYTYKVRSNYLAFPNNAGALRHEEYDWVTLITCHWSTEDLGGYFFRQVVRAVLVDVSLE
jgi:sortase (surface protein transpeptidase)